MLPHKTTTSSGHWCDGCGEYFSIKNPGIVLTVKECTVRHCLMCLRSYVKAAQEVASAELLAAGA